jgi:four helix bundle protein
MRDFKDLGVWQRSRDLATSVYDATEAFPAAERFVITDQLRRAAVSISTNLAEGNARLAPRDQARFYRIALGSAREVEALLILATDRKYLSTEPSNQIIAAAQEIQRMIIGLLRYCHRRQPSKRERP